MPPALLRCSIRLTATSGLLLCALLWWWKVRAGVLEIAGCGGGSGCANVLASRWSQVLMVPVSAPAAGIYLLTLVATWKPRRDLFAALAVCLGGAALWFLLLQVFALHSFCPWCLASHACGVLTSIGLLAASRHLPRLSAAPGWILGSGTLAALVAAQILGPAPANFRVENLRSLPPADTTAAPDFTLAGGAPRHGSHPLPRLGPPTSVTVKASVALYFDYTCPSCRTLQQHLDALLAAYPGQISVVLLPVPLDRSCNPFLPSDVPGKPGACDLARLALAAWLAAPDRFPTIHATLFAAAAEPAAARDRVATLTGRESLERALADPWLDEVLRANVSDYRLLAERVHALPKLVLNGKRIVHGVPPSREVFLASMRRELGL